MSSSTLFIENEKHNKDILFVSFGGSGQGLGKLNIFEFQNFLKKNFSTYNQHYYLDKKQLWYTQGIDGISTNINETSEFIKNKIKPYKKVIFIGSSAGGYAAILFGSLLKVTTVIAFNPQTFISRPGIDKKYSNLKGFINNTTKYYLFGDISVSKEKDHLHHISHCENLEEYANVIVKKEKTLDLKQFRDSGKLFKIFQDII